MPRSALPALLTAALVVGLAAAPEGAASAAPVVQRFANCTDLHRTYPAGVAKQGVTRNTVGSSSRPLVGAVKFSTPLYEANRGKDRDRDGIACELS